MPPGGNEHQPGTDPAACPPNLAEAAHVATQAVGTLLCPMSGPGIAAPQAVARVAQQRGN